MAGRARTDVHFSVSIETCACTYSFGLDWRGKDAPAPLAEGLIADLDCIVETPTTHAQKRLSVKLQTAPALERSLRHGGPKQTAIGHLIWGRGLELALWLPSDASWWQVVAAISRRQFSRLSFSARAPLRGTIEVTDFYLSGDEALSEAERVGRLIEGHMGEHD